LADPALHRLLALLDALRTGRARERALAAKLMEAPVEAVARQFGVKPRMAHEYVRRAREHGFLPQTTQGKKKI